MPNLLTVLRILLVPVLAAALLSGIDSGDLLAAIVFVIASITDALDGWIARRNKDESTFGKLMDPLADKLLVTAALVSLVSLDPAVAALAGLLLLDQALGAADALAIGLVAAASAGASRARG